MRPARHRPLNLRCRRGQDGRDAVIAPVVDDWNPLPAQRGYKKLLARILLAVLLHRPTKPHADHCVETANILNGQVEVPSLTRSLAGVPLHSYSTRRR